MATRIGIILLGGAIAQALAAKDPDIEKARLAYEDKRFDDAKAALDKAQTRRGERPEIAFNQGLLSMLDEDKEAARKLFERASEAQEEALRASAWFELGNLAFDQEDWAQAIEHYVESLSANPQHEDAKWNLELALIKQEEAKKEQEKQKDQDQENQDQEDQDQEKQDQEKQDQEKQDQEEQDEQKDEGQDEQEKEGQDASSSSSGGEPSDQENSQEEASSSGEGDSEGQNDQSSTQEQEQGSQEEQEDQSSSGPQESPQSPEPEPEPEPEPQEPPADAQAPKSNLDRALEELDRADPFLFGAPKGRRRRPVKEDW